MAGVHRKAVERCGRTSLRLCTERASSARQRGLSGCPSGRAPPDNSGLWFSSRPALRGYFSALRLTIRLFTDLLSAPYTSVFFPWRCENFSHAPTPVSSFVFCDAVLSAGAPLSVASKGGLKLPGLPGERNPLGVVSRISAVSPPASRTD